MRERDTLGETGRDRQTIWEKETDKTVRDKQRETNRGRQGETDGQ